jgi:hypothetical protein
VNFAVLISTDNIHDMDIKKDTNTEMDTDMDMDMDIEHFEQTFMRSYQH